MVLLLSPALCYQMCSIQTAGPVGRGTDQCPRIYNKRGAQGEGGGKTQLLKRITCQNPQSISSTDKECGPEAGEPSPCLMEGDSSCSSAHSCCACLSRLNLKGTCLLCTVIIGSVLVQIKHLNADAGTPDCRPLTIHASQNTVVHSSGFQTNQG